MCGRAIQLHVTLFLDFYERFGREEKRKLGESRIQGFLFELEQFLSEVEFRFTLKFEFSYAFVLLFFLVFLVTRKYHVVSIESEL